ncbi:MAG TPA: MATE family efflux transporter [Candidatus Scybalocola faecigallinarum]|uniref:MATE family efflux transporter n=1 Tax=Candidatus Scybalocola faecigallinarum TaxID=2840941 RepID=A0A9D1JRU4_9FIRM|nr:MATE family efflux transporter [Candidatus Scybalocola faecigallinarum]
MSGTKKKSYEMDMCHGPLVKKLLIFTIPVMISGVLQLLFNAADIVVVGQFVGSQALAAVGSNSSLINLIVNVFIGISIGSNVLVARHYGAGEHEEVHKTVHTAILTGAVFGVLLIFIGQIVARPLLELMGSPEDVIDLATLYLRIYFVGMPMVMVYDFGASILRAVGDTRRPLYFLVIAGVVNVVLNLFFVIVCHLGVAGVALATIISQTISAILVVICLMRTDTCVKLTLKELRIHKRKLLQMMRIGLPAGVQGAIFSVSNVLIQSSVNSFGSVAMAGNAAAANIEGFIYTAMNSFYQAALSFTSQNAGAGEYKRVYKILGLCLLMVTITGFCLGNLALAFGRPLLGIYTSEADVVGFGLMRMKYICTTYFLCGMMDVTVGSLRGLGYSITPMLVSLTGACAFRVVWIFTVFVWSRSLDTLYVSYPVSWLITAAVQLLCFFIAMKRIRSRQRVLSH